jgi:hypothetical protein
MLQVGLRLIINSNSAYILKFINGIKTMSQSRINCFLSFLKFVILEGKLLKIFTAAYETPFWKHDRLAIGL